MHIHILGICGTFMAGIARLARELGMTVTGSDAHAYPPMSEQLAALGIDVMTGYEPAHLDPAPDCVVIGNAMTRGNPAVEHVLDKGLRFTSGPAWLAEHVLGDRWVLAVSGTHGKTTATSMLTWILECAGYAPGFLIGGVPENFSCSARLGKNYFVVEADEYDSAFFDKRSKFVHYLPKTLVINNLEFDHGDIFDDMAAIRRQFHHLVRTVPASGRILRTSPDPEIDRVMDMGCWTPVQTFTTTDGGADWQATMTRADGGAFDVSQAGNAIASVRWPLIGGTTWATPSRPLRPRNTQAWTRPRPARPWRAFATSGSAWRCAAVSAASPFTTISPITRRRSARPWTPCAPTWATSASSPCWIRHPTPCAAACTKIPSATPSPPPTPHGFSDPPAIEWDIGGLQDTPGAVVEVIDDLDALVSAVCEQARGDDHIVIMSNSGFAGFHQRLLDALQAANP